MKSRLCRCSACCLLICLGTHALGDQTLYVDASAHAGGDGTNWRCAYRYLQDALAVAQPGDEVHVAAGVYRPDASETGAVASGDRHATFTLIDGLVLRGGYAGYLGRQGACERNPSVCQSALCGDLAADDGSPGFGEKNNAFHVLTARNRGAPATLEGFTIRRGYADEFPNDCGGGMLIDGAAPRVARCRFIGNQAVFGGAIFAVDGAAPELESCALVGNRTLEPGMPAPADTQGPVWVTNPEDEDVWPSCIIGSLGDLAYGIGWPYLTLYDGNVVTDGAELPRGLPLRRFTFTPAGVFIIAADMSSQDRVHGSLWKSTDGLEPFVDVTPAGGCSGNLTLHHTITYVGATPAHPGGVLFFFEYANQAHDSIVFCSTDNGDTWWELMHVWPNAIRHFHGGVWVPERKRLYVMTGDSDAASTLLFCDDVDDMIANPEVWEQRWALVAPPDGHPRGPVDPTVCANDNLGPNGYPVSTPEQSGQEFRMTDLLVDEPYVYWGVDSGIYPGFGNPIKRFHQDTGEVITLAGPQGDAIEYIWGMGWQAIKLDNGMKIMVTNNHASNGVIGETSDSGGYCHMYLIVGNTKRVVDIAQWQRTVPFSGGAVVPLELGAALDRFWIWWSRPLEATPRRTLGQIWPTAEPSGGAILSAASSPCVRNCTFVDNDSPRGAAVAYVTYGGASGEPPEMRSCIFSGEASQIFVEKGATVDVRYSCIAGGLPGEGNIETSPMLEGMPAPGPDSRWGTSDDVPGDLHPSRFSPCLSAGDPHAAFAIDARDLTGHARVLCGRVDMGAYEFGVGDADCNHFVDSIDYAVLQACATGPLQDAGMLVESSCRAMDFDLDGDVDLSDYAGFIDAFTD